MVNDRDFDGIPDKMDSTFNTPEEVAEMKGIKSPMQMRIEEEQLHKIWQANIPIMVKQKGDEFEIIYEEEYDNSIRELLYPPRIICFSPIKQALFFS